METVLLDPMYECPGSGVRYVLIDESVIRGQNRAHYWSRSEGAAFYSMLAAEEERDATEQKDLEQAADAKEETVPTSSEQPAEADDSLEPRRRRASAGSNFP